MKVEIITPSGKFLEQDNVKSFAAPGICGDFGVMKNHVAFVTMLREGVLVCKTEENEQKIRIRDGIFEVLKNKLIILAESAEMI